MITPEYCRVMARYNAWQNNAIWQLVDTMESEALDLDRGAFFGSIRATLNHILWGDQLWMSRFDDGDGPACEPKDHVNLTANISDWWASRFRTDGRIKLWAAEVSALDLVGELSWYSVTEGREIHKPVAQCVAGFFNHQTHHRGQVHAMLTAAGMKPDDTDLVLMPVD